MQAIEILLQWDRWIYHFVNRHLYQSSAFFFFEIITNAADLLIFLITIYWIYGWLSGKRSEIKEVATILAPVFITAVITIILKVLIQRGMPRPLVVPWTEIRIPFLPWGYAFPSGHASRAFALATAIAVKHREKSVLLFLGASLIAFSRVYIGAHFPLDVIAGALLGSAITLLFVKGGRYHDN